jgi:DNA-binding CsgD family transcriptional regulator
MENKLSISYRETEVLAYIAQGLVNKQIAVKLKISEPTVKTHRQNILSKLNAMNMPHAVAIALNNNLFEDILR